MLEHSIYELGFYKDNDSMNALSDLCLPLWGPLTFDKKNLHKHNAPC